jgi:aldose 1-epimerase
MDVITLRAGDCGLQLAPEAGGMVTRYWLERGARTREWLRPASGAARARRDGYEASAFPLVPYSNRIRAGRFRFGDRDVALPLNRPPERHSIHGQGWQAAWTASHVSANTAQLEFRHAADAWPWAYRATQRFALSPTSLTVELALHNQSDAPMPAGLGWHPYFLRTPRTTLTAPVAGIWLTDAEMMPTELARPPVIAELSRGVTIDSVPLDNCFTGWSRRAVIDWPELDARLVMTAEPPLDFLTVFTPPDLPFFCVEPVSHATDAVNLTAPVADVGQRRLESGGTLRAIVTLTPEVVDR